MLDLDAFQKDAAASFARHPEIAVAYVFGSVARGEARADSDLDVGVVYHDAADAHDRIATTLAIDLARLTAMERIDVVDLATQGPIFAHRALVEGTCVYETDRARRADFESEVVVRAIDFRPTYELATRGKASALKRWLEERYDLRTGSDEARRAEDESRQAR